MVTYLGSVVQLSCGEGGTLQTNNAGVYFGNFPAVYGTHCVFPSSWWCVLSASTLLRFQVAQQQNYLRWVLGCVHFPDLHCSGSGSQVFHKGTGSVGPVFCALPRSEQLR